MSKKKVQIKSFSFAQTKLIKEKSGKWKESAIWREEICGNNIKNNKACSIRNKATAYNSPFLWNKQEVCRRTQCREN